MGPLTNDTDQYFPLGGFHYIRTSLRKYSRPELLLIDAQLYTNTEPERWALVKALAQFGSFSGLVPAHRYCSQVTPPSCSPAGFDTSHAVLHSRYVSFVSKDVLNAYGRPFQRLNRPELRIFNRYANPTGEKNYFAAAGVAVNNAGKATTRQLPLVAVGGYVETGVNVIFADDFWRVDQVPGSSTLTRDYNVPFDDVLTSLQTGRLLDGLPSSLPHDLHAETNILITLICHADHDQPRKVCNRAVIKQLLRHVK